MYYLITKIVSYMQNIYIAWHFLLWGHYIGLARLHDDRIRRLAPHWRDEIPRDGIEQ